MTLVVACLLSIHTFAVGNTDIKPKKIDTKAGSNANPEASDKKYEFDSIQSTEVNSSANVYEEDRLYPTRPFAWNAWTVGGGFWLGNLQDKDTSSTAMFTSLTKTNYNLNETAQEFGVQITSLNMIGAHWGFKWLPSFNAGYEMFYKAGFGALYLPSENIGTLINFRRYYLFTSLGFEDLFQLQRHLRADITGTVSPIGFSLLFNIGFVFSD